MHGLKKDYEGLMLDYIIENLKQHLKLSKNMNAYSNFDTSFRNFIEV